VGIEELDNLQMEIESLLVDAMQRTRTFKLQIMMLENGEESLPVKRKPMPPSVQTTPYKTQKKNKIANSKLMLTPNATKPVCFLSPISNPNGFVLIPRLQSYRPKVRLFATTYRMCFGIRSNRIVPKSPTPTSKCWKTKSKSFRTTVTKKVFMILHLTG
jgi:hypothetical protein